MVRNCLFLAIQLLAVACAHNLICNLCAVYLQQCYIACVLGINIGFPKEPNEKE